MAPGVTPQLCTDGSEKQNRLIIHNIVHEMRIDASGFLWQNHSIPLVNQQEPAILLSFPLRGNVFRRTKCGQAQVFALMIFVHYYSE